LSAVLKSTHAKIIVARDGFECLEKLKSHRETDLVLLDMMMPEMDGYQALKEIRANNSLKHIPVIALTAQAMTGDKKKCLDAGANDYCSKPVDVGPLFEKIKLLLHL
jgi:CheY-like chemotaxis protein